jgi:hypothetical protein
MPFLIVRTEAAVRVMDEMEERDQKKLNKVRKTLGLLSQEPRYPGLNSHKREAEKGPNGQDIWESYVENNTPSAWRVFWYYGPVSGTITVFSIVPHP